MGFSTALQGRSAHEALLARQDAELRILETMKRCLLQKAKCDKEYSIALTAVTQQGLKIDRIDDLQGSLITKAWRSIMDEFDQTAKQIKSNAELLELTICQEKLSQLYQEKRKTRKAYQEEHNKIATQFSQLTEEVSKKKTEYQKNKEYYKLLRSRFEEHYIKSGRGGRKLDDVRDKYQKACRKLHLSHNEYVLLIGEAIEVEKDFRTSLLPGLLEHQQSIQETHIQTWRNILQDASQCGDITSDKFRDIQKRIELAIQTINPAEEYREFIDKHKTSPPTPVVFQFDESLIEDTLGKLQPNTLTVDNLTVDWLRTKLNDLETSVKECQEKQSKLSSDLGPPTTPTVTNGSGLNGNTCKEVTKHSKDLNSLRCHERQMLKLVEIIKNALNEVGCEELPSGCDDISVDQTFIESNVSSDQPGSSSFFMQKGADIMSAIKAPFKRKSGQPITPERTPRSRRQLKSPVVSTISLGSSVNSLNSTSNANDLSLLKIDANVYVDVDSVKSNNLLCENNTNLLTDANASEFDGINGSAVGGCGTKMPDDNVGDSKNNLLLSLENQSNDILINDGRQLVDNDGQLDNDIDDVDVDDGDDGGEEEVVVIKTMEKHDSTIVDISLSKTKNVDGNAKGKSLKSRIKKHMKLGGGANSDKNKLIVSKSVDSEEVTESPKIVSLEIKSDSDFVKPDGISKQLENDLKDLEKLIETTDLEIKKKTNKKKKSGKKSENKKRLPKTDDQYTGIVDSEFEGESKSFSNRSMNALLTSFRDLKNFKSNYIENSKSTSNSEMFENDVGCSQESRLRNKDTDNLLAIDDEEHLDGEGDIKHSRSADVINSTETEPPEQFENQPDTKEYMLDNNCQKMDNNNASSSTSKSRTAKFKENLKTKLKFNMKLSKGSKKQTLCKTCSKCIRKIHPSPTVADFEREYHTEQIFGLEFNDFCVCNDDEFLTIKNHEYSDLNNLTLTTNRPLYEEEWFHGVLPREEVVRLLRNEGDFLVRETTRNDERQIVLSVCWNGHKHFLVQTTPERHYRFEGPAFPSIRDLIQHQYQSELPVTGRSGAILKKPVPRERWELSNDDVILLDKIGRGNFGDVYKARLKSYKNEVAVKTCRMTLPDEQKRKFLQEGRILKQYDHPNIVKLIGICVQKQPIMIVMELVSGGSLFNFLRKNALNLNTQQLMGMCRDAAAGMRYLESKNCIHRDLAARNCLIGYENIVKISDFGMSREEEEYIVSDGMKQIPIKWTAPEALNFGKYTSLCDVWSYGILMWEIFSKCDTPYTGMSNSRARERIDAGYRMPAPENTPPEIYRLMLKCWSYEPESRPHFDEIFNAVDAIMSRGET